MTEHSEPSSGRGDKVRVTVFVKVPPAFAFEIFTQQMNLWWRRGPAYRVSGKEHGTLSLEPKLGGRITESNDRDEVVHEVGEVLAWDPPHRLVFSWRSFTFVEGETTSVEVLFAPSGANGESTKVTVEHRGWSQIRDDHPVRHGRESAVFVSGLGTWWGALMTSYRERCALVRGE